MDIQFQQVLTQIVAFLITYWILKRYAWKPAFEFIEQRRSKIAAEFQSIEDQKLEHEKQIKIYEDKMKEMEVLAAAKIDDAVAKAQEAAKNIEDTAQKNAKMTLNKAQQAIENEIAKAKVQLKDDVASVGVAIAEKIMKVHFDEDKKNHLVKEFGQQVNLK